MARITNLMILGYSGSGKDTQAALVQQVLEKRDGEGSVLYVYTGANLREAETWRTYNSRLITEKIMNKGAKAPDFLAIWAWAEDIMRNLKENQHIILSSSPRTILEAKTLDDMFAFYERENVYPVYLNVKREEAYNRLLARERSDDTPEIINNRFDYFGEYVLPAVDYYRTESKHALIEIDGNSHDEQKIHEEIKKAIGL
ncbi:MAG: nucleoside monophosphate kinase [bacterium]|nr:nucleoside monophosphate kinase [bacterium]